MFTLLYVLARFRRPVRLLECPDRASLLRPGGLPQGYAHPAAGAGTGFMRLSGRFTPLTFWKLGFRQSGFRHIARISRHTAPYASATAAGFPGRGRLPGEVPNMALLPGSPLPNPPCDFHRNGLSGDHAVNNAAVCSA